MPNNKKFFWDDSLLILTMALLAGCGLIYEYLLSHYAGRVLGVMESTIYTMIGLMIVSMGIGAFAARYVKCAFNGFQLFVPRFIIRNMQVNCACEYGRSNV